jgi:uncharacterized C2H2 Zn-finger protein
MFSCERCDKEFTEKRDLTRHQKNHLQSKRPIPVMYVENILTEKMPETDI